MFDEVADSPLGPPGPPACSGGAASGSGGPPGRSDSAPGTEGLAALLGELTDLVDRLAGVDVAVLDGPKAVELASVVGEAVDRLAGLRVRALPVVEADGRWALDGARTFPQWVARRWGGSVGQARRDVRVGHALRDELPATERAVTDGRMSLEHARVLAAVAATSEVRRQVLAGGGACDEEFLVAQAQVLGVDPFRTLVRHWAATADPDACDRGFRDAVAREFLELSRTMDGYHLAGFLTEEHGQQLSTALAAVAGVPTVGDDRSAGQRRAQAVADLARLALDHGLAATGAAVRPHLSVHVDLATLRALAAGPVGDAGATAPADVVTAHTGEPCREEAGRRATTRPENDPAENVDGNACPGPTSEGPGVATHHDHPASPGNTDESLCTDSDDPAEDCATAFTSRGDRALLPPPWPGGRTAGGHDPAGRPGRPDEGTVPVSGITTPAPPGPPSPARARTPHADDAPEPARTPEAGGARERARTPDVGDVSGSALGGSGPVPATFDDGTPVPMTLLARLACDSEITRIVFGAPGIVLDVGRARRTVTGQLRRAVIARDRTCTYPQCTAPPAMTEVHHPRHWARGGVTSLTNSCLLCWHHHDLVHRLDITITMRDGTWRFTDRNGNPIGDLAAAA